MSLVIVDNDGRTTTTTTSYLVQCIFLSLIQFSYYILNAFGHVFYYVARTKVNISFVYIVAALC